MESTQRHHDYHIKTQICLSTLKLSVWLSRGRVTYLLHVRHVVVVVAVLHLLRVDVDGLLGGGEGGLGGLRVGARGHGGGRGRQGRVHLLLRGLVGQVEGLGRGRRCNNNDNKTRVN